MVLIFPAASVSLDRFTVQLNAQDYEFWWYCDLLNTTPDVACPDWQSPFSTYEWYQGAPYDWGAWDYWSDCQWWILDGYCTGVGPYDYNPGRNCGYSDPYWATGLDCSGFVSRCWELESKHSTATLPNQAHQIEKEDLSTGDILDKPGQHVILFLEWINRGQNTCRLVDERWGYGYDPPETCRVTEFVADLDLSFTTYTAYEKNDIEPRSQFYANPTHTKVGQPVNFYSTSVGASSYLWDFGDGSQSYEQNPSHTYWQAGKYTVWLEVYGWGGDDRETKRDYITVDQSPALELRYFYATDSYQCETIQWGVYENKWEMFYLWRSDTPEGPWVLVDSIPEEVGVYDYSYIDSGVQYSMTYYWALSARTDPELTRPISGQPSGFPSPILPPTPLDLVANDHPADRGDNIDLSWNVPPEDLGGQGESQPPLRYDVYRGEISGFHKFLFSTEETSCVDSTVLPGRTYYYVVRSYQNGVHSSPSNEAVGEAIADRLGWREKEMEN